MELTPGDYFDIEQDTYGHIEPCPFCGTYQTEYATMYYNGPGSPPSYAVACGSCNAQGPTSMGRERGDHFGAREHAVKLWNDVKARALKTKDTDQ